MSQISWIFCALGALLSFVLFLYLPYSLTPWLSFLYFSTLLLMPDILCSISYHLFIRLTSEVSFWHLKFFFISSFISVWVFFGHSGSLFNSIFMSWIVFIVSFSWLYFHRLTDFIHLFFRVLGHNHNSNFEALELPPYCISWYLLQWGYWWRHTVLSVHVYVFELGSRCLEYDVWGISWCWYLVLS